MSSEHEGPTHISNTHEQRKPLEMPDYKNLLREEAPHLAQQLDSYFDKTSNRLLSRVGDKERVNKGIPWAGQFISAKMLTRLHRAEDLSHPDEIGKGMIDQARDLSRGVIGENNANFYVTCIDGRNLLAIMFSHVPHFGGAIRSQAGDLPGFAESMTSSETILDPNSFTAGAIEKLLVTKAGKQIYYNLDSHIGCAARGRFHGGGGGREIDTGLLADIERKLHLAEGIGQFAGQLKKQGKEIADIIPQLFSYDPHDGTLYIGLEMHVEEARQKGGFSGEMRDELAGQGKIIRTWDLLHDEKIVEQLEALHVPLADFRNSFAESLLNNWKAISTLYGNGEGVVHQHIYSKITQAYELGGFTIGDEDNLKERKISVQALENKAKIMLKNLVTRWSLAQAEHEWPFSEHLEQSVVVTEGGFGPFEAEEGRMPYDAFAVFAKEDLPSILEDVKLAIRDLIRPNRRSGQIVDPVGMLEGKDFTEAPIVIMNHAVLRDLAPEAWEKLKDVDFVELFSRINWDDRTVMESWSKADIADLVGGVIQNNLNYKEGDDLIEAFWDLFQRVQFLMRDSEFRSWIVEGRVLMLNKLVDYDRKPQALAPMVF